MDDIYEEIFDEKATEQMKNWNLQEFKMSHPTLFNVIIESMKVL